MARGRGVMEGSMWPKIAALCLVIAFLFHLISFGSPNWAETDQRKTQRNEHIGLWRYCVNPIGGGEVCSDFIDVTSGDWLKAAQSFGTLAFFAFLGAVGVSAMYAFVPDFEGDMRIVGGNFAASGLTFLFLIIECGVFGGRYHEYFEQREPGIWYDVAQLSWAFGLGVASAVFTFIAIVLMAVDVMMGMEGT